MPVEQINAALDRIVAADAEINKLGDGFRGDMGPAEEPSWWKEGGYLVFSDIGNILRMKWPPTESVTLLRESTDYANGVSVKPQTGHKRSQIFYGLPFLV